MLTVVWHNIPLVETKDKIVMRPANTTSKYKARTIASALFVAFLLFIQQTNAYDLTKFPGKGTRQAWKAGAAVYNHGNELAKQGNHKEAIEEYKRAIAIYPFDAACYFNAGIGSAKLLQHANAVQYFRKAVELAPDDADAFYALGNSLWKLKNFSEAERAYKKSIAINPKSIDPKINLGELYLDMKRPADAKKILMEALALPDSKLTENKTMIADDLSRANKALDVGSLVRAGK